MKIVGKNNTASKGEVLLTIAFAVTLVGTLYFPLQALNTDVCYILSDIRSERVLSKGEIHIEIEFRNP